MKWTDGAVGKSVSGVEGTIVGVFDDIRNRSFYSSQSPIVLIADKESANHTINVRLKEPYDENLKRLNECVAKTFPNVALNFNSVDSMIREGYKSVYRFRNAVWISSCFILLIVITGLIGYVNGRRNSTPQQGNSHTQSEWGRVLRHPETIDIRHSEYLRNLCADRYCRFLFYRPNMVGTV